MKRREWIGSLTALAFSGLSAYANKKAEFLPKILLQEEEKQTESWTQGNVRFTWLQDNNGEKRMPNSLFSGADAETIQRLSPEGGALATISCFLVQSNGKNILFDTGNGKADSRLLPNLASLQIQPEDIDYLFLTHFHGDHIGGMLSQDKVVFTQAEVYVPQQEYDAWMQMPADKNQQVVKTMKAYEKKLHKINGGDKLPEGIIALNAFGHTPGHTIYQVKDTLIAGDLLHGAAIQIPHPEICASFDMDKKLAIQCRKQYLQYVKDKHLTLAGMHLPVPGFMDWKKI